MPQKRKRRASPPSKTSTPPEHLKQNGGPSGNPSPWGWVGTEITDVSQITPDLVRSTCGFSSRNNFPFCSNPHIHPAEGSAKTFKVSKQASPKDEPLDVIVISEDEETPCSKKLCKANPNCLNHLGQDKWDDEEDMLDRFIKASRLGEDPSLDARDPDTPVGLKNLGATCYANASLQVWFRDLTFRNGVYNCRPSAGEVDRFRDSPVFQLQVTFAALQESTQNVYNPIKLVESLQLRTTEQQDAQEFSKLFMSHLDAEFKKQSLPAVRSLVTDQFQGRQVYGTICNACGYRSERPSDFLEIEINFEESADLEERLEALLQSESLSGDNKYSCSGCDSLQDATRYTELRKLPPILHFSLLRFVYDFATMERKKSKHSISFPAVLDMNQFLGSEGSRKGLAEQTTEDLYELRGVLLHKGPSAYHGHYEAQIYDDVHKSWFQFNDEVVTKIKVLGDQTKKTKSESKGQGSQKRKQRVANARKRRRVDDSDEDPIAGSDSPPDNGVERIVSKDAYMLIYARQRAQTAPSTECPDVEDPAPPRPPHDALEVVNTLNAAHDDSCENYAQSKAEIVESFKDRRNKVLDIYRSWNITNFNDDSLVVSKKALEIWLVEHCLTTALPASPSSERHGSSSHNPPNGREDSLAPAHTKIGIDEILCEHNRLDPKMAGDMKRIKRSAHEAIIHDTKAYFSPQLTPDDVCEECVRRMFIERLYQIEHPRLVHQFDKICEVAADCRGYWISKDWVKNWKLVKPKMHVSSVGDPSPDDPEFVRHVRCEHDSLTLNIAHRRRISVEAVSLLQVLFPAWDPLSTADEPCAICDALIHVSKEDRKELRKRAEEEKANLKYMYDNALGGSLGLLEDIPCAIIPTPFLKAWKLWLNRPTETQRPESIDNSVYFCEHSLLVIDPNVPTDLDGDLTVIKRSDWEILAALYTGGPLIAIERRPYQSDQPQFIHDIEVCIECRTKRKSDWDSTDIIVRLCGNKEPPKKVDDVSSGKAPLTYLARAGARQSKRLRQVKEFGERRRITISKSMTVKDIKIMLQELLSIPTICQRLFLRGQELDENATMVASLPIFANDILDLREEQEVHSVDSDSEDMPTKKQRREEERGFGGTLLGGVTDAERLTSSREETPHTALTAEKSCQACTFSNDVDAISCTMCDTPFI